MKNLFITCLIAVFAFEINSAKAQDLIVKERGDSLNCKIINIKRDSIYFVLTNNNNETLTRVLSMSRVQHYKKEFYTLRAIRKEKGKINYYPKFRLGVQFGRSHLTAKQDNAVVPVEFKEYLKKLRSGYNFGGDFTFFVSKSIGFGAKYSSFGTHGQSERFSMVDSNGHIRSGNLSSRRAINYIGPSISLRAISANQKVHYIADFSWGYMLFKENFLFFDDYTFKYKGAKLGYASKIGIDVSVGNNCALGLYASCTLGSLKKMTIDYGPYSETISLKEENYYNISRIDISLGFRWNK